MIIAKYTDLVTPSQVADQSMNKLGTVIETALRATDGSGEGDEIRQAGLRFIDSATQKIEAFLNRKLIVRLHTQRWRCTVAQNDFKFASEYTRSDQSNRHRAYFRYYPVVQIVDVDGDVLLFDEIPLHVDERSEYAVINFDGDLSEFPTDSRYFAGFRRYDQDQPASGETWNSVMSTSDLALLDDDTVVDILPGDISDVCARIVIANLNWHFRALIGIEEQEVTADRLTFRTKKAVGNYEFQQLQSIHHHRTQPY